MVALCGSARPRVVPAGLLCKMAGAKSLSGSGYKSSFQPKRAQSCRTRRSLKRSEAELLQPPTSLELGSGRESCQSQLKVRKAFKQGKTSSSLWDLARMPKAPSALPQEAAQTWQ